VAKREITVSVDESLVDAVQRLDAGPLSAVVNRGLAAEVERRARAAALGRLLAEWDAELGPVDPAAAAAFDDLDAVDPLAAQGWPEDDRPGNGRRRADQADLAMTN
jgi:hypothetical protein